MFTPSRRRQSLLAVLLVLVLTLLPATGSTAAPPLGRDDPPPLPEFARGTAASARLTEIEGSRSYQLVPRLVEAVQTATDSIVVTYEVGIPLESMSEASSGHHRPDYLDLLVWPAFADSESHYGCDSSISVCATLTLVYTEIGGDHGYYGYSTNKWTRIDPAVTWSNAKMKAGCNAEWWNESGRCQTQVTKSIGVPTSGTPYKQTPWFAGSSHQVAFNTLNGIAAYQSISLKRGSSNWSFSFCVNHEGSEVIMGCY